ncbi:MAG: hypothetical protein V4558_00375 [Gemmatimonadota bacterium]
MFRCHRAVPLLPLLLLVALPLSAQTPAERVALGAWEDSLQRVTTVADLAALEGPSKSGGGAATAQVRRAAYVLRRGELKNDVGDLDAALFDFAQAASRHGDWPWPRYDIARGLFAQEQRNYSPKATGGLNDGESHATGIWRALRESADRDVEFDRTRETFLHLALATEDRLAASDFIAGVRRYARGAHPDPRAVLVLGRIARSDKDYRTALAMFDSSLTLGGDAALIQLERARTLQALGRSSEAVDAYYAGLRRPTAIGRAAYLLDFRWIVSKDSVALLQATPDSALVRWVERFWAGRDAEAVRESGERLVEHLRRWNYVRENFRVVSAGRRSQMKRAEFDVAVQGLCIGSGSWSLDDIIAEEPADSEDIRRDERFLDHRGVVYLRHGEPRSRRRGGNTPNDLEALVTDAIASQDATAGLLPEGYLQSKQFRQTADEIISYMRNPRAELAMEERIRSNESWLYWINGSWRVLHFTGSDALGLSAPTTLVTILPLRPELYLSRASLAPAYVRIAQLLIAPPARAKPVTCDPIVAAVLQAGREDVANAGNHDSYTQTYSHPFLLAAQFFGLGSAADNSARILTTFAVPGDHLHPAGRTADGRLIYPMQFRLTLWDGATGTSRTIDTTRNFVSPDTLRAGSSLNGVFETPLPPGSWQVGVTARQDADSSGGMVLARGVRVDAGGTLSLGDVLVGREGSRPGYALGGQPFPLNPGNAWATEASVELGFEVRGLAAGADYRTVLEVTPLDPAKKHSVRIETGDRASGAVTTVRKSLALQRLDPGNYRLTVTVTADGKSAQRERGITVIAAAKEKK